MNVKELVESLKEFPENLPVYLTSCHVDGDGICFGETSLDAPKPVRSHLDPAMESGLPEEARLGEFVLLEPCVD